MTAEATRAEAVRSLLQAAVQGRAVMQPPPAGQLLQAVRVVAQTPAALSVREIGREGQPKVARSLLPEAVQLQAAMRQQLAWPRLAAGLEAGPEVGEPALPREQIERQRQVPSPVHRLRSREASSPALRACEARLRYGLVPARP